MKLFRFHRALLLHLLFGNEKGLRILDYGCGRGEFLQFMRFFGWDAVGTEFSLESSVEVRAKEIPIFLYTDNVDILDNSENLVSFDVITSYHNLEHLSDPVDFIRKSAQLLKRDGKLIIEVPNIESIQFSLAKQNWILLDIGNHRSHFSAQNLTDLLAREGFKVSKSSTLSLNYGVLGMLLATQTFLRNSFKLNKGLRTRKFKGLQQMNIVYFLLLLIPSFILEMFCVMFKKGAVVRIYAKKDTA